MITGGPTHRKYGALVRKILMLQLQACSSGRSTTQVYGMPRDLAGDSRSNLAYHSLRMPSLMPLVRLPVQVARAW